MPGRWRAPRRRHHPALAHPPASPTGAQSGAPVSSRTRFTRAAAHLHQVPTAASRSQEAHKHPCLGCLLVRCLAAGSREQRRLLTSNRAYPCAASNRRYSAIVASRASDQSAAERPGHPLRQRAAGAGLLQRLNLRTPPACGWRRGRAAEAVWPWRSSSERHTRLVLATLGCAVSRTTPRPAR